MYKEKNVNYEMVLQAWPSFNEWIIPKHANKILKHIDE